MNLIILTSDDRVSENSYCLNDKRAVHIREILHLKVGDCFQVGILDGQLGTGRVSEITDNSVSFLLEQLSDPDKITPEVDLICALPRPQTLKKVLFIAAMTGVRRLFLIRANRVEKSYYQSPLLEKERMQSHLIEGLSQGKRTRLPKVTIHQRFKPFFEDEIPDLIGNSAESTLLLLPEPDSIEMLDTIYRTPAREILLAIGPEGGWVDFEIELMKDQGFVPVSLGRSLLRVEHAVTASLSQIDLVHASLIRSSQ